MKLLSVNALSTAGMMALGLTLVSETAQAQTFSGAIEGRAIYADGNKRLEDEEDSNRSAYVLAGNGEVEWIRGEHTTRLSLSSTYNNFTDDDRDDRWNNEVELVHEVQLSPRLELHLTGSLGTDYSTLEYREADQVALGAELFYAPSRQHRFSAGAGYRHREYDNAASNNGQSPYIEASYRYRPSNRHRLDLSSRIEWLESDNRAFELTRQRLSTYYTLTPDRLNRFRVGLVGQNWEHDSRLVAGKGETLHRWRVQPQARYTRSLPHDIDLEIDYRLDLSRSNDPAREEDGNRLSVSLRKAF